MARIQAAVHLDRHRAPEQEPFLRERVTILRQVGTRFRVSLEESQVAILTAEGMTVYAEPDADQVELPGVVFRPARETAEPPAGLRATEPEGSESAYYLVQFEAPIDKRWLQDIAGVGGEFLQGVPGNAAVFRFSRDEADVVRDRPFAAHVGLYHAAYAVTPELAGVAEPFTAASLRDMRVSLPPAAPEGNLALHAFEALDPEELRAPLEAAGAVIASDLAQGFQVHATAARVEAILRVPGVYAAEVPTELAFANDNAGVIIGANQVRLIGTVNFLVNLDGAGEVGGVLDSGFDLGSRALAGFHADLRTNLRMIRNGATPNVAAAVVPDLVPHGTHVAGTIVGDGTWSGGSVRGIAPRGSLVALSLVAADPTIAFEFAFRNGARVINNSWGHHSTGAAANNEYGGLARAIDRWSYGHPDVLLLFAAGNEEQDTIPAGGNGVLDARWMRREASAKNVLTVGASETLRDNGGRRDNYRSFLGQWAHAGFNATAGAAGRFTMSNDAGSVALFSGRGLVRGTRRVKPDVVAPGTNILSCRAQNLAAPPPIPGPPPGLPDAVYNPLSGSILPGGINRARYQFMFGTSMATPMVSGSAMLVRQYYRTRFAQMRRPLLLEGVPVPAAPPLPAFGGLVALAPHPDGLVAAWITPELPANAKRIVAVRLTRRLGAVDAAPVVLQADVGDHAAPKLVTRGNFTFLLHRHGDGTMRLSCYDRALAIVTAFGSSGVVTLAPNARPDDDAVPDLRVEGSHLVCAFPAAGGTEYRVQRVHADTSALVDAASVAVLSAEQTGPHRAVVRSGTRYTVCGVSHPGNFRLQLRQMADDGSLVGAAPVTLVDQPQEIREPCILWDARAGGRHVVVWCDARTQAGGEIYALTAGASGAVVVAPRLVVSAPAASRMRRPRILPHPEAGYILVWEDDSQNGRFDLYVAFLDDALAPDARIDVDPSDPSGRRLIRISDTPEHTEGFAALCDAAGLTLVFQSPDEINSDRMGVYAIDLTPAGAFEAQEDPATPLLRSGRYVTAETLRHDAMGGGVLTGLTGAWTGGAYYVLRENLDPGHLFDKLEWVRLNADGRLDTTFAIGGVRGRSMGFGISGCDLHWTGGDRLVTAVTEAMVGALIFLDDENGAPVVGFAAGGPAALVDAFPLDFAVPPQLGSVTTPALQISVAYGTTQGGALHLRYQRLDDAGVQLAPAVDLAVVTGVAKHGWVQFATAEARFLAIYHRAVGPVTRVHCRLFGLDGAPVGPERDLSAAAGEAINAVLARRPTAVNAGTREYGAVWQFRAAPADPWQLRFSRLLGTGAPRANPPLPAPAVQDVAVVAAGVDWPADRQAVEPQLVSTYTHEPVADPPISTYAPTYGLAWIGVHPDGSRVLYFTVLDANGQRLRVPQAPPPPPIPPALSGLLPPAPVPLLQVSATGSIVRNFRLIWNGRAFLLCWVEEDGTGLRHQCSFVSRYASRNAYDAPSAALLRATLVNGATNMSQISLPVAGSGYGWGRVNLRQTLSPAPPATFLVRDDCALGPGRSARYRLVLPAGTALLKVTLTWTDPPNPAVVNPLHLTLRRAGAPLEYHGNRWDPAAGRAHLSLLVPAADPHENDQIYKQIVVDDPAAGEYEIEVSAGMFPASAFNQQNLQAFALVAAGTGPEVRFSLNRAAVQAAAVY